MSATGWARPVPEGADRQWVRSQRIAVAGAAGRSVVLNLGRLRDARPFVLEGPALLIWNAIGDGATAREVSARIARDTGVNGEGILDDVVTFLDQLASFGFVEPSLGRSVDGPDRSHG